MLQTMQTIAPLIFVIGLGMIVYYQIKSRGDRVERQAEERVRAIIQRDLTDDEEKIETDKRSRFAPLVDKVSGRIQGSDQLRNEEGRHFMQWLDRQLTVAGLRDQYTPERALAIALLVWGFGVGGSLLLYYVLGLPVWMTVLGAVFFALYPPLKLKALRNERQDTLKAEVPFFIQQLYMALSSGMITIDEAIAQVSRSAKEDPYESLLSDEFGRAHTEYRLGGVDREVALRAISNRTGVMSVENLIEALIQGLRTGAPLDRVLAEYAGQARELWRQDMRTYKNRKEPLITLCLVLTMFGAFIIFSTPMLISLGRVFSGIGG